MTRNDLDDLLQERQHDIEQDLCDALADESPASWTRIDLRIERVADGVRVSVRGPDGDSEKIVPNPAFQRAVVGLLQVYRERGVMLDRAVYALTREGEHWTWSGQFQTSPQA